MVTSSIHLNWIHTAEYISHYHKKIKIAVFICYDANLLPYYFWKHYCRCLPQRYSYVSAQLNWKQLQCMHSGLFGWRWIPWFVSIKRTWKMQLHNIQYLGLPQILWKVRRDWLVCIGTTNGKWPTLCAQLITILLLGHSVHLTKSARVLLNLYADLVLQLFIYCPFAKTLHNQFLIDPFLPLLHLHRRN